VKRRKGWHIKHNKMPVKNWPAALVRMGKRLGIVEKLKEADEKESPLFAAFIGIGIPIVEKSRAELSEMYPHPRRNP
jgi:hypothetical protein